MGTPPPPHPGNGAHTNASTGSTMGAPPRFPSEGPADEPPSKGRRTLGFPGNRRDGARQLSVAVLVAAACLVRVDHPVGRVLALLSTSLVLVWWALYRRLER